MLQFHEKRKIRAFFTSRMMRMVLLLLIIAFAYPVWSAYRTVLHTRAQRAEMVEKLDELELRKKSLEADIATLDDERGVEEVLRERFELGAQEEEVVVFVENDEDTTQQKSAPVKEEKKEIWDTIRTIFLRD